MIAFENRIPGIYHLLCPFGGCWTGITLIRADKASYLIDCGGNAQCVDEYLLPALEDIGMTVSDILSISANISSTDFSSTVLSSSRESM